MNNALTKTLTHGLMHGLVIENKADYRQTGFAKKLKLNGVFENSISVNGLSMRQPMRRYIPYLFPMSSLTKEIEFKGERFVPIDKMSEELKLNTIEYCWIAANIHQPAFPMKDLRASVVEWMQKHMFNVEQLSPEEFIEVNETNNPYK